MNYCKRLLICLLSSDFDSVQSVGQRDTVRYSVILLQCSKPEASYLWARYPCGYYFSFFSSLLKRLYPQHLADCPSYSKYSINICWMNQSGTTIGVCVCVCVCVCGTRLNNRVGNSIILSFASNQTIRNSPTYQLFYLILAILLLII